MVNASAASKEVKGPYATWKMFSILYTGSYEIYIFSFPHFTICQLVEVEQLGMKQIYSDYYFFMMNQTNTVTVAKKDAHRLFACSW